VVLVSQANATCGQLKLPALLHHQSWQQDGSFGDSFLLASDHEDGIVGLWKADFTAKGNTGIPDGTPIDSQFIVWHADKTEIMNSSRPPQQLNHLPLHQFFTQTSPRIHCALGRFA